jgi:hypothetical protein
MTGWTKNPIIDPKQTKHNKGRERTDEYSDPSMGLQVSIPAGGDLPCIAATPTPPMTKRARAIPAADGTGGLPLVALHDKRLGRTQQVSEISGHSKAKGPLSLVSKKKKGHYPIQQAAAFIV